MFNWFTDALILRDVLFRRTKFQKGFNELFTEQVATLSHRCWKKCPAWKWQTNKIKQVLKNIFEKTKGARVKIYFSLPQISHSRKITSIFPNASNWSSGYNAKIKTLFRFFVSILVKHGKEQYARRWLNHLAQGCSKFHLM